MTTEIETRRFRGATLTPTHQGYDEARQVFNGLIDRRPAKIMRCTDADDVAAALAQAHAEGLPVSVYGGGHGVTGSAVVDDGLCIDLRGIDHVIVDPQTKTARVGGGATWGQVDAATQAHGLAMTGGRVSTTGVGGLSLGSGSGWLERKLGFVCDQLVEAQLVTADSRMVTASETENPDLFWAIRGGGGNYGVVTEFTFRLAQLGPIVFGGMLLYPGFMAADVIKHWRDFMLTAPDEVGSGCAFITAPPEEFVPEPARGQPCLAMLLCYAGDPAEAADVLRPLLEFGPPAANLCQPMPYAAVQQLLDPPNQTGMHNYWSGDFLTEFPDEAVDALVSTTLPPTSPLTQVIVVAGGGAIARVDDEATAFGNRQSPFNMHYLGMWPPNPDDDNVNIAKIRSIAAALKPWSTGSVYLNFIGDEGQSRVQAAFGARYDRMRQLKRVWDPENVFRHNQNIPPAD